MARAVLGLLLLLLIAPSAVLARKRASQSSGCVKSTLPGYTSAVDLNGKGLMFHWKVSGSTLSAAVQTTSNKGSVSVGFSKGGKMFPADVVTGYSGGAVKAYKLTGYSGGTASKVKASGISSTTFKFTRSGNDGTVPINYAGSNTLIWAYGTSNKKLTDHGKNRGSKSVDLTCVG
ncbi:hypothetical protein CLOM_g13882 [Closterium sp. NIES-68]|nr:hypothetical protein CLOM_g18794 [Closterium sp. NIES-68]GJP54858.1 hypothetical protein CLOM_g13882 [Closterium sp. NIES-68]GJP67037.1 hypothetical protein CLOP_g23912 [Closterium sp. NIES-67]GJP71010.1 hypothetical protein CLOP_g1894 [Closterium sp. NIES-67]